MHADLRWRRVSYQVHAYRALCLQWIASPPGLTAARNLLGVSCCFIVLIPSTAVIVWLYISEAVHYSKSAPHDWHAVLLLWFCIIFCVITIIFFVLCCVLCVVRSRSLPCVPNNLQLLKQLVTDAVTVNQAADNERVYERLRNRHMCSADSNTVKFLSVARWRRLVL